MGGGRGRALSDIRSKRPSLRVPDPFSGATSSPTKFRSLFRALLAAALEVSAHPSRVSSNANGDTSVANAAPPAAATVCEMIPVPQPSSSTVCLWRGTGRSDSDSPGSGCSSSRYSARNRATASEDGQAFAPNESPSPPSPAELPSPWLAHQPVSTTSMAHTSMGGRGRDRSNRVQAGRVSGKDPRLRLKAGRDGACICAALLALPPFLASPSPAPSAPFLRRPLALMAVMELQLRRPSSRGGGTRPAAVATRDSSSSSSRGARTRRGRTTLVHAVAGRSPGKGVRALIGIRFYVLWMNHRMIVVHK